MCAQRCVEVWKRVSHVFEPRYTHTRTHTLQWHTTRGIMTKDDDNGLVHKFNRVYEVKIFSSLNLLRLEYDADGKFIKVTFLNAVGKAKRRQRHHFGLKKLEFYFANILLCNLLTTLTGKFETGSDPETSKKFWKSK